MASRLFRAVVGIGISLGTASVACFGGTDDPPAASPDAAQADPADSARTQVDGATSSDAGAPDVRVQGDADAGDAAPDAPKDAGLDAFCDASWPTTKGNPGGPTCGDVTGCADAGYQPRCVVQTASSPVTCNPNVDAFPAWCVSTQWQCSEGSVPQEQCECWVGVSCP
jgi:hypothetical protein